MDAYLSVLRLLRVLDVLIPRAFSSPPWSPQRRIDSASAGCFIYSESLRLFFRARFRAKACFARRFSPGFR